MTTNYAAGGVLLTVGKTTFRLERAYRRDHGHGPTLATWQCVACGYVVYGTNDGPFPGEAQETLCAQVGHTQCTLCGHFIRRLRCGCPRVHTYRECDNPDAATPTTEVHLRHCKESKGHNR